jgi:uncharacterized protein YfaS (alpha-2-macroglobulin family)
MNKYFVGLSTLALVAMCILMGFQQPTTEGNMIINENYEAEWKKIDSLERKGLPQSALQEVEALYDRATADNNQPQRIKTVIYLNKFKTQLEEDGLVKAIGRLDAIASSEAGPVRAILLSMMGELYNQYLNNESWRIRDRTNIQDFVPEDMATWTIDNLINESGRLYLASIADEGLKKIAISDFDAILHPGMENEGLRPTLYDFLAHRAIDYFQNSRSFVTEPAYAFQLQADEAFADATTFVATDFPTRDTLSRKYRTLKLLQEIMAFRLQEDNLPARVDLDLKRLQFVYNNATNTLKDSLYRTALERLAMALKGQAVAADVQYDLAQYYISKAREYDPQGDQTHRWSYKRAKEIIEKLQASYPDSYAAGRANTLMRAIEAKTLSARMETVVLPAQPILVYLSYRNVPEVQFKLIKLSEANYWEWQKMNNERRYEWLASASAARNWTVQLPDPKDYHGHATEIMMDPLPLGNYVLVMSENGIITDRENPRGMVTFQVSRLAAMERDVPRGKTWEQALMVVDRSEGNPLQAVDITLYQQEYNQRKREQEWKEAGQFQTAKNGFAPVSLSNRGRYLVRVSRGEDVLFISNFYNQNGYYRDEDRTEYFTHFFLDRAIYRPGQTVYFKGLVYQKNADGVPRIAPDRKLSVTLFNVNRDEVGTLELVSNAYGTVEGTFQAPQHGLLGRMFLEANIGGTKYFRVEEYKRPKFKVTLQPFEGDIALGDQVTAKGEAMTFAGSAVDGAMVKYRVVREVRYPWWPWWRYSRFFPPSSPSMEIAIGETQTDAKGQFTIPFEALPDRAVDRKQNPAFTYTVYADVVDITGETHSAESRLSLGYLGFTATIDFPATVDRIKIPEVGLDLKNLNGQAVNAKGKMTIYALNDPGQYFIDRYWPLPDQYSMDEKTFKKAFPLLPYGDENDPTTWEAGKVRYQRDFDTAAAAAATVDMDKWPVGYYRIEVETTDKNGNPITAKHIFSLFDSKEKKAPPGEWHWLKATKFQAEPGDDLALWLHSDANFKLYYELESRKGIQTGKWLDVGDWHTEAIAVEEADRGNIKLSVRGVRHNRFWSNSQTIVVPWSNKDLKIEWMTFRDVLKPGQEEEWIVKVSGPKTDQVSAEIVASMYDASLDQFITDSWDGPRFPSFYSELRWQHFLFGATSGQVYGTKWNYRPNIKQRSYRQLNWFNWYNSGPRMRGMVRGSRSNATEYYMDGVRVEEEAAMAPAMAGEADMMLDEVQITSAGMAKAKVAGVSTAPAEEGQADGEGQVRTNLKETVFFFPTLETDEEGNVRIRFTMNEALTTWKFRAFAHTKALEYGLLTDEVVTRKELMVMPNPPRFMREGDRLTFTAKVTNLSDTTLTGTARLQLFDAISMAPVDQPMGNTQMEVPFTVPAGQSAPLAWELTVPKGQLTALTHRVSAKAGNFTDGEESTLPILTNRMLVTESMPLPVGGKSKTSFTFKSFAESGSSTTLDPHRFTLEYTSNPAWYAVQALPYLMEYPHACSEQIFSRFYANALATSIANRYPKIQRVYESWRQAGSLESNLTKNEELKAVLLEETPWVLQAQSEAEQKKRIALLFDLNRMSAEQENALKTLADRQLINGGFSWFPGGRDNWYITQYIVEGLGHLSQLTGEEWQQTDRLPDLTNKAIGYLDARFVEHYEKLKARAARGETKMEADHLTNIVIHYLYARSMFREVQPFIDTQEAHDYYLGQAKKYWLNKGQYQQGLLALSLHYNGDNTTAGEITKSLRERALQHPELGMYWKYNRGYYWYQMPIETHALMIEVFAEVAKDAEAVDQLKVWLLKNKQTTHWKTTKATASAVYALLYFGENWLTEDAPVQIRFPKMTDATYVEKIAAAQQTAEAGTGYFKVDWDKASINTNMATIEVENPNAGISWGAAYWQYFEDLDKIEWFEETPLKIQKSVFKKENTEQGPQLKAVTDESPLVPGDVLTVRIEVRVDRDMEYVHLKDMRASGLEPMNVLSQYKWQDGLGYYESTKDVATHFFISYLPKGTYVFEYPVRVIHRGDFSNGITTMQCMYAPEFTTHSEGIRILVE